MDPGREKLRQDIRMLEMCKFLSWPWYSSWGKALREDSAEQEAHERKKELSMCGTTKHREQQRQLKKVDKCYVFSEVGRTVVDLRKIDRCNGEAYTSGELQIMITVIKVPVLRWTVDWRKKAEWVLTDRNGSTTCKRRFGWVLPGGHVVIR